MLLSVRLAFRVLRKDPLFTAVAVGSLAIGIGATSAGFSFADALLLRPLPVVRPDRVVTINTYASAPFGTNSAISYPDYIDLRDQNHAFGGLLAASYAKFGFSPDAATLPRMKFGLFVSGNFFRVLGVEPAPGRGFNPGEDQVEGRDQVVVLGHDFWISQFRGNPSALGSRIRLNGIEFTVIGVAPESFTGIDVMLRPALFVPLAMSPRMLQPNILHGRDVGWLIVKGRLKPEVSVKQANADIAAISAALQKLHTRARAEQRLKVETELQFRADQGPTVVSLSSMLALLGVCVLLVSCANVAGLLLSRARARSREIAVRLAVGAGRGALVRQLLLENLLVAIAGGLGGILVSGAIAAFWRSIPVPSDLPVSFAIGVNPRVLLFTLTIAVSSTLLFGLAPALRITRPELVPALKAPDADSGGKQRLWGRNTIVAGQVALSMVLLAVSATLVEHFESTLAHGPGYRTERVFQDSFDTQLARYSDQQTRRFYEHLLERVRSAPGVRSAAIVSTVPMAGTDPIDVFPEGWQASKNEQGLMTLGGRISEGYFQTMDIAILRGRDSRETDREDTPAVAIVNEHLAAHYWPKSGALGQRFHLGSASGPLVGIVGVVRASKYVWIAEPRLDFVYLPFRQHPASMLSLVIESNAADAATLAPVLRAVVHSLDPDMPAFDVRTMHELYTQRAVKTSHTIVEVVAGMGLAGLLLAIVGLYGLVAYSVSRRTREIAIRMAVGADREKVVWMVLRQGLRIGIAGVAVGLVAGFLACRAVSSAVWVGGAQDADNFLILPAIAVPLLLITVLATWAPARRASLVDPMRALRDE